MNDIQDEIDRIQSEIRKANADIADALRRRREVAKDSGLVADYNAALATARESLNVAEIKLRTLYESKEE